MYGFAFIQKVIIKMAILSSDITHKNTIGSYLEFNLIKKNNKIKKKERKIPDVRTSHRMKMSYTKDYINWSSSVFFIS